MSNLIQLEPGAFYQRREDMSPEGFLRLLIGGDGDVIVSVMEPDRDGKPSFASVEFCHPGSGGGRSPRTRAALLELARAMIEDNQRNPMP